MSKQSYSHNQFENKLKRVIKSQKKEDSASKNSAEYVITRSEKNRCSPKKRLDYEYHHPTNAETIRMNATHIRIEKWFGSTLSLENIWLNFLPVLEHSFSDPHQKNVVEEEPHRKKWIHTNQMNNKLIVTLTKHDRFGNLKVSKRIANWGPAVDGILHGTYISLLIFGVSYAIFQPSTILSIAILIAAWLISALSISIISKRVRKKKQKQLVSLADKIINSLADQSENSNLQAAKTLPDIDKENQ